jgi:hypothetical protein
MRLLTFISAGDQLEKPHGQEGGLARQKVSGFEFQVEIDNQFLRRST